MVLVISKAEAKCEAAEASGVSREERRGME